MAEAPQPNFYSGDFMDIEVLRRAPLFATLDDDAFRLLTDELTEVDLSRGASVFREAHRRCQPDYRPPASIPAVRYS